MCNSDKHTILSHQPMETSSLFNTPLLEMELSLKLHLHWLCVSDENASNGESLVTCLDSLGSMTSCRVDPIYCHTTKEVTVSAHNLPIASIIKDMLTQ